MITLKEWMELVDYRITEGSDYNLYGHNAYNLSSWNGEDGGHSLSITFSTLTQVVYCAEVCDYGNNRAYRLLNPDFKHVYNSPEAWDNVDFIDLEVDDDFMQKALAIIAGEDYDDRVSVPLTLSDEETFAIMKLAHERDMTLNSFVEEVLQNFVNNHPANRQ